MSASSLTFNAQRTVGILDLGLEFKIVWVVVIGSFTVISALSLFRWFVLRGTGDLVFTLIMGILAGTLFLGVEHTCGRYLFRKDVNTLIIRKKFFCRARIREIPLDTIRKIKLGKKLSHWVNEGSPMYINWFSLELDGDTYVNIPIGYKDWERFGAALADFLNVPLEHFEKKASFLERFNVIIIATSVPLILLLIAYILYLFVP